MALDPRFIVASDLESYFVDKLTGLPLAAGVISFFSDVDRTTPKNVYQLSGSPPNYTYTSLGPTLTLSGVGTVEDNMANNIVVYYFPYDGTPDDSDGTVELYYITVVSEDLDPQFTREGWPNFTSDATVNDANNIENYVPNGQFLLHNDNPTTQSNVSTGAGTYVDITAIAPGGWYFKRTHSGLSTFDNSFVDLPVGEPNLNDFPKFAYNYNCTSYSVTDGYRDVVVQWNDVNKFSASNTPGTTSIYTLFLAGDSQDSTTHDFDVRLICNFGTGGSPTTTTDISVGTFTISTGFSYENITITFPDNSGATLGTNGDDFVAIALRGPQSSADVWITDIALQPGTITPEFYPIKTNAQMIDESMAGQLPIPSYDGSDFYLPLVATPTGLTFDSSEIGDVVAAGNTSNYSGSVSTTGNRLLADGSQYLTSDYSALGIPYARLQAFYSAGGASTVPQFGTGANFATAYVEAGLTSKLVFTLNKVGSQTAPVNGGVSPTFSYTALIAGSAGFNYLAYTNGSTLVTGVCMTTGPVTAISAGTSGMTVTEVRNVAGTFSMFDLTALTASALGNGSSAGKYFDFSNTTTRYRMWFQTATESTPATGGNTLVKLNLDINMTAADVAGVLASAISGFQVYNITCVAAASIPTSSYFNFTANSQIYTVWYTLDNVGTQPVVSNALYIPVSVTTGQTAAQVATATQTAINAYYFAVPNLTGLFLRGYDTTGKWDIDYLNRFSMINTLTGGNAGTFELDGFTKHTHTVSAGQNIATTTGSGSSFGTFQQNTITSSVTGGPETVPVNVSVVWAIKY